MQLNMTSNKWFGKVSRISSWEETYHTSLFFKGIFNNAWVSQKWEREVGWNMTGQAHVNLQEFRLRL